MRTEELTAAGFDVWVGHERDFFTEAGRRVHGYCHGGHVAPTGGFTRVVVRDTRRFGVLRAGVGEAHCNVSDVYDRHVGEGIATRRALADLMRLIDEDRFRLRALGVPEGTEAQSAWSLEVAT